MDEEDGGETILHRKLAENVQSADIAQEAKNKDQAEDHAVGSEFVSLCVVTVSLQE